MVKKARETRRVSTCFGRKACEDVRGLLWDLFDVWPLGVQSPEGSWLAWLKKRQEAKSFESKVLGVLDSWSGGLNRLAFEAGKGPFENMQQFWLAKFYRKVAWAFDVKMYRFHPGFFCFYYFVLDDFIRFVTTIFTMESRCRLVTE